MGPTNSKEGRAVNFILYRHFTSQPWYITDRVLKSWRRTTMESKMKSKYIFIETESFVENQLYFNVQYFHFVYYRNNTEFNICDDRTLERKINCYLDHDPSRGYKMYKVIKKNRWVTIKCLVLILGLHSRAVVTANNPLRKLERGEFNVQTV